MTPVKVIEPGVAEPHILAKPARWLWEVRRYMARHGGACFGTTGNHFRHFQDAKAFWPTAELISLFNDARKAGSNQ